MKRYKVYGVYSGCLTDEVYVDTLKEAKEWEKRFIKDFIDAFGEEVLYRGIGDFCTYIEDCESGKMG